MDCIVKYLSDVFPVQNGLEQGDLTLFLFNLALEYAIKEVCVNNEELGLVGTHQLLVYTYDVDLLG
jgi:hypothetical protein